MSSPNLEQLLFFSGVGCCVSLALLLVWILGAGLMEGEHASKRRTGS